MIIPDSIRIGGHDVTIEVINGNTRFTKYGDYSKWDNRIRINSDGTVESTKAETFMHEIIEAIDTMNELGLPHNAIASLSEGLFAVIRNNKLDFINSTKR